MTRKRKRVLLSLPLALVLFLAGAQTPSWAVPCADCGNMNVFWCSCSASCHSKRTCNACCDGQDEATPMGTDFGGMIIHHVAIEQCHSNCAGMYVGP